MKSAAALGWGILASLLSATGCDGPKPSAGDAATASTPPSPKVGVTYRFADGLREQHAEVAAFMEQFLETCLARDYEGYRRLIATSATPDSRERFDAAFNALQSVTVDRIEARSARELGLDQVWLVHWTAQLDPESNLGRRKPLREVSMVVHREGDQWRLQPAPPALHPRRAATGPATEIPESGPSYPWDEDE